MKQKTNSQQKSGEVLQITSTPMPFDEPATKKLFPTNSSGKNLLKQQQFNYEQKQMENKKQKVLSDIESMMSSTQQYQNPNIIQHKKIQELSTYEFILNSFQKKAVKNINPVYQDLHKQLNNFTEKKPKKKTRFHKTQFRIRKTNLNIQNVQSLMKESISKNLKANGTQEKFCHTQLDRNSIYAYGTLDFAAQLTLDHQIISEQFGFDPTNLKKNKLLLEHVILTRLSKRKQRREEIKQAKEKLAQQQNQQQSIEYQQQQDDATINTINNAQNNELQKNITAKLDEELDNLNIQDKYNLT